MLQGAHFLARWRAGARRVDTLSHPRLWTRPPLANETANEGNALWFPETHAGARAAWTRVARAVTSPPSMTALTWAVPNCHSQLRSPVLADLRRRVDARLDDAVADLIGPLRQIPKSRGLVLFAARAYPPHESFDDRRRLDKARPGQRSIANLRELVANARRYFGPNSAHELEVRVHVFDSATPFALQVAAFRRARVVVGIHGGALAGALWMAPGQALVEITPQEHSCGSPSMFANVAVAVGARYHGVLCAGCSMKDGGRVHVQSVMRAIASVLNESET